MPGKLLWKLDPGAVDRLAARLPRGSALISATNGKTTTAAMAARILAPSVRLAHNRSGANLVSGVASALLAARDAELGLFEVDEAALPEVARRLRPGPSCSGTSFATSSTATASWSCLPERWRGMVRELAADASLVVNGDDPQLGDLARSARIHGLRAGRSAARLGRAPACRRFEVVHPLRDAVCVRGGLHRPSRGLPLPGLRPRAANPRRARARNRARGPRKRLVPARDSRGHTPGRARRSRALQRLQRARCGVSGSCARVPLDAIQAGLQDFSAAFGRFERIAIGERSLLVLLIKNPAGANEVVRTLLTGATPRVLWWR